MNNISPHLQELAAEARATKDVGFFGSKSHIWLNHRYRIRALNYFSYAIIVNANPIICEINSHYFTRAEELIERGLVTQLFSYTVIFFFFDEALEASAFLKGVHRQVVHKVENILRHALEPDLMLWVWCAVVQSSKRVNALLIGDAIFDRQTYEEYKVLAELFGIEKAHLPNTLKDFDQYWNDSLNEKIHVTPQSKALVDSLLEISVFDVFFKNKLPLSFRRIFKPLDTFTRLFCIYTLPEQISSAFGLSITAKQKRRLESAIKCVKILHSFLPQRLTVKEKVRQLFVKRHGE